jgi:hypothetical protein
MAVTYSSTVHKDRYVVADTTKLQASVRIHAEDLNDHIMQEDYLKHRLISQLVDQLYNLDIAVFKSAPTPDDRGVETYNTQLTVFPNNITSTMQDAYVLHNESFTKEQIDKALLNTYPELFI